MRNFKTLLMAGMLSLVATAALAVSYTSKIYIDNNVLAVLTGGYISTPPVALAVSTTITQPLHAGRPLVLGGAGSARTMTLPAATGTGSTYTFIVGAVNTSNYVITKAGSDTISGNILYASDNASNAALAFEANNSGTITLNGTTQGGASIGDRVILTDCASAKWCVTGQVTETGSEATPFS